MEWLEQILPQLRLPGRYTGGEVNSVRKDPGRVDCRLVLAYPDLYEIGMSYLGLQVLYQAVNREPDLWAERVFAPDRDLERQLQAAGRRLFSLESRTPLADFDIVGFTRQHELNDLDILAMLRLGGIPVRSCERTDAHPLVLLGGPGASHPEPLAEALDAVFVGDGISDRCAVKEADLVLAKDVLRDWCREHGYPYEPVENFRDVLQHIRRLEEKLGLVPKSDVVNDPSRG